MSKLLAFVLAVLAGLTASNAPSSAQTAMGATPVPVTLKTFARAESDTYFAKTVKMGGLGKFIHIREPTPIDKQDIVREIEDLGGTP